uniref:Uncharacterized protein n=1 Tax=Fagus sylvatica TaxID=28930 RepID=A0A2N9F0S6_FAGSY
MASSSGGPDPLVALHFHDFRAERMQHWWDLLEGDDRASIKSTFGKFSVPHVAPCGPWLARGSHLLLGPFPLLFLNWGDGSGSYFGGLILWEISLRAAKAGDSFGLIPSRSPSQETGRGGPDVLCAVSSAVVLQSSVAFLPSPDSLLPYKAHMWKLWTHYSHFDGMPLLGMWGCTGCYPGLALRQFGGLQYLPRLGDLSLVTFDYVSGGDMWKLLSLAKDIWVGRCSEVVFVEDGLSADSSVTAEFVEWREGWSPSFTPRPTVQPGVSHSSVPPSLRVSATTGQSERVTDLERELEEARVELATLRLARASKREEFAARVESMQSHPHDIVALRRALDESEASLTAARTSIGAMRVQISVLQGDNAVLLTEMDLVYDALKSDASWLNRKGVPVVRALHQATRVVDSLGARARTILEEHDEGDPAFPLPWGDSAWRPAYVLVIS